MGVYAKKISSYASNEDVLEIFNNYFSDYASAELNTDTGVTTFSINNKSCEIEVSDNKFWTYFISTTNGMIFFVNTEQDNESIIIVPNQTDFSQVWFVPQPLLLIIGTNLKTNNLQPMVLSKYSFVNVTASAEGMNFFAFNSNAAQNHLSLLFYPYFKHPKDSGYYWKASGSELLITRMGRVCDNEDYLHENLYTCSNHIQLSQGVSCTDGNDYFVSIGYGMYIKSDEQATWL